MDIWNSRSCCGNILFQFLQIYIFVIILYYYAKIKIYIELCKSIIEWIAEPRSSFLNILEVMRYNDKVEGKRMDQTVLKNYFYIQVILQQKYLILLISVAYRSRNNECYYKKKITITINQIINMKRDLINEKFFNLIFCFLGFS